jgi:uncharacterized glyoxalase superfamily protein PhnB
MANGEYCSAVPVIATDDVAASVDYFVRVLGFVSEFLWGDPPVYAGVSAGKAVLYLARDSEMARVIREHRLSPELFLWVTGVDSVYARHQAAGAQIVEALSDRPWGARQYVLREPNGYHMKIAEALCDDDD